MSVSFRQMEQMVELRWIPFQWPGQKGRRRTGMGADDIYTIKTLAKSIRIYFRERSGSSNSTKLTNSEGQQQGCDLLQQCSSDISRCNY